MSHAKVARLAGSGERGFGHVRQDRLTPRETANHQTRVTTLRAVSAPLPPGSGAFFFRRRGPSQLPDPLALRRRRRYSGFRLAAWSSACRHPCRRSRAGSRPIEFLRWLESRAEAERWELVDGEPVRSMAPETVRHVELKRNLLEALRDALRTARPAVPRARRRRRGPGRPAFVLPARRLGHLCRAHRSGRGRGARIRSWSPRSSPPAPGCAITPSKLVDYFAVPSVQHYLLIETRRRLVLHHRRGAEDEVVTRFLPAGRLRLDPPGLELDVEPIYAGTDVA